MAFINKSIYQKNIMQSALNSMPVQVRDRTTPVGAILCQGRNARRASKGNRVNIPEPGCGGGRRRDRIRRRRRGPQEEFSFLFNSPPTLKLDHPEIGSSGW